MNYAAAFAKCSVGNPVEHGRHRAHGVELVDRGGALKRGPPPADDQAPGLLELLQILFSIRQARRQV